MKLNDIPVNQRPEILYNAYTQKPCTYQDLALQFSCHPQTVYRHLAKFRKSNGGGARGNPSSEPTSISAAPLSSPDLPLTSQLLTSKHSLNNIKIRPGGSRPYPRQALKAAVFDIETTDFSATGNRGFLICCSILPLDADAPHTHAIPFGANNGDGDKALLEAVIADLSQYDVLIGHYILGFDLTWLYTRADHYELPALRRWLTFDTCSAARAQKIRTPYNRKSLAFLLDHFGLDNLKTSIFIRAWEDIRSSKPDVFGFARSQIIEHCELDVIANRMLYDRLEPKSWAFPSNPFRMTSWAGVPQRAS